jgi:hypothetical protein
MKPFSQWTPAEVFAHNERILQQRAKKSAPIGLIAESIQKEQLKKTQRLDRREPENVNSFSIKPSHDEDKLNKTERAYLAILRARTDVDWIGIQSVTLKIADDCRLTCDFIYLCAGVLTFVDTKGGFIREDSTIKIKVAARMFPWAKFVVAQRISGTWTEKVVNT